MRYLQLKFDISKLSVALATEILESHGALSISITSANKQICFDVVETGEPQWEMQRLSTLFELTQARQHIVDALNHRLDMNLDIEISLIEDRDWVSEWVKNFKPFRVGRNLWICSSYCDPIVKEDINLIIDPGMAFGTGTHETTRLCLEYLSRSQLTGKTVIDFGCGSGILGIAACKLGASSVVAIDIDLRATDAAKNNAKINQVKPDFAIMTNDQYFGAAHPIQADLVIANILANTLIECCDAIIRMVANDGQLLLSGVLESQAEQVISAYQNQFEFIIKRLDDWVLLVGEPKLDSKK